MPHKSRCIDTVGTGHGGRNLILSYKDGVQWLPLIQSSLNDLDYVSTLQQTPMTLSSEQPPPSTALLPASQTQVFQPVSKAPHSSGINVNAAPFQSMQTVRHL